MSKTKKDETKKEGFVETTSKATGKVELNDEKLEIATGGGEIMGNKYEKLPNGKWLVTSYDMNGRPHYYQFKSKSAAKAAIIFKYLS